MVYLGTCRTFAKINNNSNKSNFERNNKFEKTILKMLASGYNVRRFFCFEAKIIAKVMFQGFISAQTNLVLSHLKLSMALKQLKLVQQSLIPMLVLL